MAATKNGIEVINKQFVISIDHVKIGNLLKLTHLWLIIVHDRFKLLIIEERPFKCKAIMRNLTDSPSSKDMGG